MPKKRHVVGSSRPPLHMVAIADPTATTPPGTLTFYTTTAAAAAAAVAAASAHQTNNNYIFYEPLSSCRGG